MRLCIIAATRLGTRLGAAVPATAAASAVTTTVAATAAAGAAGRLGACLALATGGRGAVAAAGLTAC